MDIQKVTETLIFSKSEIDKTLTRNTRMFEYFTHNVSMRQRPNGFGRIFGALLRRHRILLLGTFLLTLNRFEKSQNSVFVEFKFQTEIRFNFMQTMDAR